MLIILHKVTITTAAFPDTFAEIAVSIAIHGELWTGNARGCSEAYLSEFAFSLPKA
jgi:hypothetical protein